MRKGSAGGVASKWEIYLEAQLECLVNYELGFWRNEHFTNFRKKIAEVRKRLKVVQQGTVAEDSELNVTMQAELDDLLEKQ